MRNATRTEPPPSPRARKKFLVKAPDYPSWPLILGAACLIILLSMIG
jgi:hypothetical protein